MPGLQPLSRIVVTPEPRDLGTGLKHIGDHEPVKDGLRPIEEILPQGRLDLATGE